MAHELQDEVKLAIAEANYDTQLELAKALVDESLSKGWKSGLAAAAALGAAAGAAYLNRPETKPLAPAVAVRTDAKPLEPEIKGWSHEKLSPELQALAWNESRLRHDIPHAKHSKGDYHTAFGALGLKPVTAHWEFNHKRNDVLRKKYPKLVGLNETDFINRLKGDPHLYNDIATRHWGWLKRKTGSVEKAAYAWRFGLTAMRRADPQHIDGHGYVHAFRNKLKELTSIRKTLQPGDRVKTVHGYMGKIVAQTDGLVKVSLDDGPVGEFAPDRLTKVS